MSTSRMDAAVDACDRRPIPHLPAVGVRQAIRRRQTPRPYLVIDTVDKFTEPERLFSGRKHL